MFSPYFILFYFFYLDVIFFIYLFQRWKYPVDNARKESAAWEDNDDEGFDTNDNGEAKQDENQSAESKKDK